MQSLIRFKKEDYLNLRKAVNSFNRTVRKLSKTVPEEYLPNLKNYKFEKSKIRTRNEFNRIISSLKRFGKPENQVIVQNKAGEKFTKWQAKEIRINQANITRRLNQELKELNIPTEFSKFSKVQMGTFRENEIKEDLERVKKINKLSGKEFEEELTRLEFLGSSDYKVRQAQIFKDNFMKELNSLSEREVEFKRVQDYFNDIQNPLEFFKTTQQSQALQDFFVWYKNPEDYADFDTIEELVDYILNEYQGL